MAGDEAGGRFQTGLHPIVFVGAVTMAGLVGLATMFVVENNDLTAATNAMVIVGGIVLAAVSILPTVVRWGWAVFAMSEQGVHGRVGWLRPNVMDLSWPAVADVDLDQTWLGARMGYGTVRFLTTDQTVEGFAHVAHAPELVSLVRERIAARGRVRSSR